jgi:type VI secretion system protein ImpA
MSGELQKPPVVDLELLLQPISEENPSGESLRYSGLYDEIAEARRADDVLNQGEWQTELKVADYRKVIELAVPALSTKTKDLQIAAWLLESLIKQFGFPGLRDGLKLAAGLQENFWETLHPEIDEGDMEARANAISWIELNGSNAVKRVAITGGEGYSFNDFEDSKMFDIPENVDSLPSAEQERYRELKAQADKERRVTADLWRKNLLQTRRADCEEINFCIDECWAAVKDLEAVIEAKYDRNQMPGLSGLKKILDTVHSQAKKILEQKRIEEPDEVVAEEGDEEGGVAGDGASAAKAGGSAGAIQGRRDALKRLGEIADFFQKTEPHSPVSYLVQRAVKWGNMPLENWLQDVIKDESILSQLRQTLGFNTTDGDSAGQT